MIYKATEENIERAAIRLKADNLVAFPTETVYGLGANAISAEAVSKIYNVKGRPIFNPLIVHIACASDLNRVANIPAESKLEQQIKALLPFWPGPLSVVLPRNSQIPDIVTAGLNSVAVRIPAHAVALKLIKAAGVPLAAPSANPSNYVSPTTAQHVEKILGDRIDFVLDGGPAKVGLESTVLSLLNPIPEVLRPGAVTLEQLREILGEVRLHSRASSAIGANMRLLSPGQQDTHYSPRTKLIFRHELSSIKQYERVGLIAFSADGIGEHNYSLINVLSSDNNLSEIASKLFKALLEMDQAGLDLIVVDSCSEEGIGLSIMDRLKRAVGGNI